PLIITGATDRPPNADGWYNAPVTVAFTTTGGQGGVDSLTPPVTLSGEGAGQSVSGVATDFAYNSVSTTVSGINIDLTKPATSASVAGGTPGDNGWYTSDVTVSLSASDNLSGVQSTYYQLDGGSPQPYSGTPVAVQGDLVHTVTFWSVDKAGNSENAESLTVMIDKTSPTTTAAVASGAPGNNGWYTSDLT